MPSDPRSPRPTASPLIEWRGTPRVRRMGFVVGRQELSCPAGHVVCGQTLMLEDGAVQCVAQDGVGQRARCGALLYVLVIPARGPHKRRYWVADVTMAEIREMEQLELDADGVLSYFGAAFTREKAG